MGNYYKAKYYKKKYEEEKRKRHEMEYEYLKMSAKYKDEIIESLKTIREYNDSLIACEIKKIFIYDGEKKVKVEFRDGSYERAIYQDKGEFSFWGGIAVCLAKRYMSVFRSKRYRSGTTMLNDLFRAIESDLNLKEPHVVFRNPGGSDKE